MKRMRWLVVVVLAFVTTLAAISVDSGARVATTAGQASWIDVTADAVQTFYQEGVPHTDRAGNVRLTYDPSKSFFPIGIYYPQPCKVGEGFSWPPFEGDPAWDGTYTLVINRGHTRETEDAEAVIVRRNEGTRLGGIVINLPANTDLYYSVWPTGVPVTVAEGPFTSRPCPPQDADDPNFAETVGAAGFDLALVWDPWVSIALKDGASNASELKLVIAALQGGTFRESVFEEFKGDDRSGHPDVYGWYMADEPDFCEQSVCQERLDELKSVYQQHEDQTSEALFLTAGPGCWWSSERWWSEFIQVGDAACHANYPKFSSPFPATLDPFADRVGAQTATVGEEKPSWVVLQAMALDRFPTPVEMRAMAYAAIVHGATGLWQFLWDSFVARNEGVVGIRPDTPVSYPEAIGPKAAVATPEQMAESVALWNSLDASQGGLNAELKTLEPVILSPTITSSDPYWLYSVRVDRKPGHWSPIRTMFKSVGGEHYLIAVNVDKFPLNARFKFRQGMAGVDVMFENGRHIIPASGAFVDYFEPFGVHVYRFSFGCYKPGGAPGQMVNVLDLLRVLTRVYGRAEGGDFDVNDDGSVNFLDVVLVGRNLGTVCVP